MESYFINKKILPSDVMPELDSFAASSFQFSEDIRIYKEDYANFAILNKLGSGKIVTIDSVSLDCIVGGFSGFVLNSDTAFLFKCSSLDGGEPVQATPLDSNNASLSGIQIKINGTATNTYAFRSYKALNKKTANLPSQMLFGGMSCSRKSNEYLNSSNQTDIQKITLNEGEGISLQGITIYNCNVLNICIEFNVVGGGSYFINVDTVCNREEGMISIFNDSGSGKVISINSISIYQQENNSYRSTTVAIQRPYFYLTPINEINEISSNQINAINLNSQNSISSNIKLYENCKVGTGRQYGNVNNQKLNFLSPSLKLYGSPTIFQTVTLSRINQNRFFKKIVLNEGEGIALMARVHMPNSIAELIVDFTTTDAPTPPAASGETGFAYA